MIRLKNSINLEGVKKDPEIREITSTSIRLQILKNWNALEKMLKVFNIIIDPQGKNLLISG